MYSVVAGLRRSCGRIPLWVCGRVWQTNNASSVSINRPRHFASGPVHLVEMDNVPWLSSRE